MKLATPHWIVFDLDETLAPTEVHGFPVLIATLQEHLLEIDPSLPRPLQEFWLFIRDKYPNTGNIVQAITQAYGLPPEWEENIHLRASPPSADAVIANLKADATVVTALEALKAAGHHLHVLTLGHANYAEPVLHHLGLHNLFTPHIHARAFKRTAKPYQMLLDTYPQLANLPKLMVEDSPDNLVPAKALGFTTIGIGRKTVGHPAVDHHYATITEFLNDLA